MNKYKLQIADSAKKALLKIPKKDQEKIIEKIALLEDDPRPLGHTKLHGSSKAVLYRIRYGNYRVVYTVKDKELIVLILEVGNRKEIYR